jgi:hypothetical protein
MGRTKAIEDKAKFDEEFRAFMDKLQAEAKVHEDAIQREIDDQVKKYYEANNWDHARLFGNKQSDYQNYYDWSLDRVSIVIDSIGNALKEGNFPSPQVPDSDKAEKSTVDEAKEFIEGFSDICDLVIARVQAIVSAVIAQLSVVSDAPQKNVLKDLPLAGGLHLFFGSSSFVLTNQRFFSNQYIGSFQIVFEAYMSVKEAQTIGIQQILKTTEYELDALNNLIISIREAQIVSLKKILREAPQMYISTRDAYQLAIDLTKANRDTVVQKYYEYNTVAEAVDEALSQLTLPDANGSVSLESGLTLESLFSGNQLSIAYRYVREKQRGVSATI